MDAISLLSEAIDVLVSKIGYNKDITRLLIHFSLSKTDEDKSWDISKELNDIAKILLNEDDAKHVNLLASKKLNDFDNIQNKVSKNKSELLEEIKSKGETALNIIENAGLEIKDFSRGTFP